MKQHRIMRKLLPTLLLGCMLIASCDIETSGNGKLDGFWHLVEVDTLQTAGKANVAEQRLFWGVQAKLIHLQGTDNRFYLRFTHTADSLTLYQPYLDHWHQDQVDGGDIPVDDATLLAPYGIQRLEEHYKVEALDGSKMILKSDILRLYFKKF